MSPGTVPPSVRQELQTERDDLVSKLAELGVGDELAYDANFADTSQVTAERGAVANLVASLESSLAEVDHALAKVEAGTYGSCESCGQEIPAPRLEAVPTGRLCIACANRR